MADQMSYAPGMAPEPAPAPIILPSEEAAAAWRAQHQQVLTKEGKAMMVDPQGVPVQVDESGVPELMAAGYRPETADEVLERTGQERVKETVGPGGAFGLGLMSGASFGLTDVGREDKGIIRRTHPLATAGGELAGMVGTSLIPGAPLAQMGRLGARAGLGLARTVAGGAKIGKAGRLLSAGTRGAAESIPISVQQSLAQDEFDLTDAMATTALGGVLGIGLSAAGTGIRAMKGWRAARQGNRALAAEEVALKTDIKQFITPEVKGTLEKISTLEKGALEMSRGPWKKPAVAANLMKEAKALRAAVNTTKTASGVKVSQLESKLEKVAGRLDELGSKGAGLRKGTAAAIEGKGLSGVLGLGSQLRKMSPMLNPYALWGGAYGGVPGYFIGLATQPIANKLANALRPALGRMGKRAAGLGKRAAGPVTRRIEGLGIKSTPGMRRTAALYGTARVAFTQDDYERYNGQLQTVDLAEFEKRLREDDTSRAQALGMTEEDIEESIKRQMLIREFLQDKFGEVSRGGPSYPPQDIRSVLDLPHNSPYIPTPEERYTLGQYVRAAEDPATAVNDMAEGNLSPLAVETWESVYPEGLQEWRDMVTEAVKAGMNEGSYSMAQIRQINTLLGVPVDKDYTMMIQKNYSTSEEMPPPKGPPGPSGQMAEAYQTRIQSALRGPI